MNLVEVTEMEMNTDEQLNGGGQGEEGDHKSQIYPDPGLKFRPLPTLHLTQVVF